MKSALVLLAAALGAHAAGLRAGAARVDITPRGPIWMGGFGARTHASEGVRQPLYARALALDAGSGSRTVIIAVDLVTVPAELTAEVAARLRRQYGIERARLLINCSHTHSGPVVATGPVTMWDLPPAELKVLREYAERLPGLLVEAAGKAIAGLAPAQLSVGFGEAGFAANRRQMTARGPVFGVNPAGPVDHRVPVIRIAAPDGTLRAVLFAYACHNTTLTAEFYQISGDYAGVAEAQLEAGYPGTVALFLQLCGADQNAYPRSSFALVDRYGRELAAEVRRVLAGNMAPLRPPLRTALVETRLPFAPRPRSDFEAELADPKSSVALRNRARAMLEHPVADAAYPVQAIRFGRGLTLVALGGEVVVDYGLRARKEFPGEPLIVAGYSNSVMCYIPSERVLAEGGYEAVDNLIYFAMPGPFAPGVEGKVFDAIHRAMKQVGR